MELLYSLRRKPLKLEPPQLENTIDPDIIQPVVTISCRNIIAFTSHTALHHTANNQTERDGWGGHIYVCDLNTPWDIHLVIDRKHTISALEWDSEGTKLGAGTVRGDVFVMGMVNSMLNKWKKLYEADYNGEVILKALFLHSGRKVVMADKKPDSAIFERFQQQRLPPTFKKFGGMGSEGLFAVTGTGLLCLVQPESNTSEAQRECRDRVTAASVAHSNGQLYVSMVSRGNVYNCICIVLQRGLKIKPLPSLLIGLASTVNWCIRDDMEYLMISGQTLTVWKLSEKAIPVHKFLAKAQGNTTPGSTQKSDCFNTLCWSQMSSSTSPVSVCSSSVHRMSIVLAAVSSKASIRLLHKDTLMPMSSAVVTPVPCDIPALQPAKRLKYGRRLSEEGIVIVGMCVSHLGGVLVAIDAHCTIYVYKLPQPWNDAPAPSSINQTTNLLEYAIVSGCDYSDVLMAVKPALLEAIIDRVTESFQRHPQQFQQYYYHNWLTLRAALYRLSPNGQSSASDITCLQSLHCISAVLDAALRSHAALADALATVLDDHMAARDIDKALLAIDVKEFSVDVGTLQALRRLVQRTCDTSLAVIAAVPALAQKTHSGYELCTDPVAINLLRKLILLIRIWGIIRPQALPSFSRSADNLDAIYRPLTRLAALKGSTAIPPDVVEECTTLVSQVTSLRVWESLPRCCICTPFNKHYPLHFEYGIAPDSLKYTPEPPNNSLLDSVTAPMDSIRYMYLGGGALCSRVCGRCGVRTHYTRYAHSAHGDAHGDAHTAHPAQAAHDARFTQTCRCGGFWTLVSNV